MSDRFDPPADSPYEGSEEYIAGLIKQQLRKPASIRDKDDRDRIIELADQLAQEVLDDG